MWYDHKIVKDKRMKAVDTKIIIRYLTGQPFVGQPAGPSSFANQPTSAQCGALFL